MNQDIEAAQKAADDAHSALMSALEYDIHRKEGSGRQEALHEEYVNSMREKSRDANAALEAAKSAAAAQAKKNPEQPEKPARSA